MTTFVAVTSRAAAPPAMTIAVRTAVATKTNAPRPSASLLAAAIMAAVVDSAAASAAADTPTVVRKNHICRTRATVR